MSGHNDFIRTTRAIAEMTNESPNQVRVSMRRFIKQQTAAQAKAAKDENGTVPVSKNLPADPLVANGAMRTDPKPFTPPDSVTNGVTPPTQNRGTFKGIVVIDGVGKYYNFAADFDSNV